MKFEKIKLTDLKEAEYNPRKISDSDKQKLRNSINTFGVVDPIIINLKNNKIIGGHQRYNALLDEYMENNTFFEELNLLRLGDIGWAFPTTDLKIESEDYEKALNLALNKINGEWDTQKLEVVFDELKINDFKELELTGFDELDLVIFDAKKDLKYAENEEDLEKELETAYDTIKKEPKTITCPYCNEEIEI